MDTRPALHTRLTFCIGRGIDWLLVLVPYRLEDVGAAADDVVVLP